MIVDYGKICQDTLEVLKDHLYLLDKERLDNLLAYQQQECKLYQEKEKQAILNTLKTDYNKKNIKAAPCFTKEETRILKEALSFLNIQEYLYDKTYITLFERSSRLVYILDNPDKYDSIQDLFKHLSDSIHVVTIVDNHKLFIYPSNKDILINCDKEGHIDVDKYLQDSDYLLDSYLYNYNFPLRLHAY